ncbi:hypothetical protein [Micromonospora sp. NBC_01813]|uniref:hypothetical protein n=1 Tax=Micromonospora sp. NBC_01813 TaxID=2975988 RepID=UPI002DDA47F5|nr:hypothetical protein [Micromonospora sp. NBC_01813]WSA09113.1 hypothetical protein OG958_34055 [Micromonospora sp. NBC_01813]
MSDGARGVLTAPTVRWWSVLRLGLVLLWLFAAVTAWWTAPRQQSYDQATADVAAGRVVAYQWGENWDAGRRTWFGSAVLRSSDELGPVFAWRTTDGRVRWTDTSTFGQRTATGTATAGRFTGPGAAAIGQELRAAGLEDRASGVQSAGQVGTGIGFVLGVVFLAIVVGGPAPVRGTRWYWFWLVYLAPFGLGLLFWLARDRPWSGVAAAPPGVVDLGGQRRDSGIRGFAVGLLAAILIGLLTVFLHGVLGDWLVPRPGDMS